MEKIAILEILNDWNFWKKELDTGKVRQNYLDLCLKFIKPNVIVSIIGVRRSGKSYLMRQIARKLIENGVNKESILIVNFEDVRFSEFYTKLLDEVYETYIEYLKPVSKPFILLDEIHNVPKWERWVRTLHELNKAKIIISGSSSKLLAGELATVLTGRHLDIFVFPLSFKEFLHFKGLGIADELDLISKKMEIKGFLREYLEFGGFPEVVLTAEKKQLLLKYYEDILTKDVEKRYKIRKGEKLRSLARFYLTNISKYTTYNSVGRFLKTTTNTVEKFSHYLEEANLVFFIRRFHPSVKEQEKSARKVFSIDVGLANAVGFRFSENLGRLAENLVAVELKRRQSLDLNLELYYWKDQSGKEVDFVIKKGLEVEKLVQVCWDVADEETKKREIKALLKAMDELKLKEGLVITEDFEGEEKIKNKRISFKPIWKWLLTDKTLST